SGGAGPMADRCDREGLRAADRPRPDAPRAGALSPGASGTQLRPRRELLLQGPDRHRDGARAGQERERDRDDAPAHPRNPRALHPDPDGGNGGPRMTSEEIRDLWSRFLAGEELASEAQKTLV